MYEYFNICRNIYAEYKRQHGHWQFNKHVMGISGERRVVYTRFALI